MKLANIHDSKSCAERLAGSSPASGTMWYHSNNTAYIVGVAIGDGNLSNPNSRAVRLRITCDNKYPKLQKRIQASLIKLFPKNKVSIIHRKQNCKDVYVYSNKLEDVLGWKALSGSKFIQKVTVPKWIYTKKSFIKNCLKGLFETDGSIFKDRDYIHVNFTTIIPNLSKDVSKMIRSFHFEPNTQKVMQKSGKYKYVTRISKNSLKFINEIGISKS